MMRTESEIRGLSFCIIAVSSVYVTICVYLFLGVKWTPGLFQCMGFMAVLGASLIFSTTTIPYKTPKLSNLAIDPLIFTICQAAGIAAVSFPLLLFLLMGGNLQFTPFGALGACFFTVVAYTSVLAVNRVGISVGPGTWSGVGMITSFTIGLVFFRERLTRIMSAGIAIVLLVFGVFCVSTSKGIESRAADSEEIKGFINLCIQPMNRQLLDDDGFSEQAKTPDFHEASNDGLHEKLPLVNSSSWPFFQGLSLCVLTGFFDGCLMVPYKLYISTGVHDNIYAGLNYLVSFALGALVCMPVLTFPIILYNQYQQHGTLVKDLGDTRPSLGVAFSEALPSGASSGALWALANVLSVLGTATISMSISFPLTQTCMLWATAIGIFYFHEPVQRKGQLGIGVVITLAGAYFLAASK